MKCVYCKKTIKDGEHCIILDEKVYHSNCSEEYKVDTVDDKYSELPSDVIRALQDDQELCNLDATYCVIYYTDSNEYTAHGFETKEEVIQRLRDDILEPDGSSWMLYNVYHNKKPVTIKTNVVITIIEEEVL